MVSRAADRYPVDLTVEVYASHRWDRVAMQDISRAGMFVAFGGTLPVGSPVVIALQHGDTRVVSPARVTHCLGAEDAAALGRVPGVGLAFREPPDEAFAEAVEALLRRARTKQPEHSHVVVAAPESRLLERLSVALGDAGFSVATATTGMEVLGAAARRVPDLVLVDRHTPFIDGLRLIEMLALDEKLASVPVVVMADDAGDLEVAFQRGAADAIVKPFTIVELIARTRRVAQLPRRAEKMSLAGSLGDLELAAVLILLEQQRKTGRIVLSNGHAAWIDIVDGRIVDAGWSVDKSHPRSIVMELLEWKHGTFKLSASPSRRRDVDLALPITHLLLEQARIQDEKSAPIRRPV
jgi:CheY-like chemotaxis protein